MAELTPCKDHGCKGYGLGYATAWVVHEGRKKPTTKHRRVHYEATGEWPDVVRHKCDNPRCINPEHLEGGSHIDNMQDAVKRGRNKYPESKGESNGRCVLSDIQVSALRAEYVHGSRTHGCKPMGQKYGIGMTQVSRLIRGEQRG